ncbi:hypothetical protein PSTG_04452 [Puccinia striiformis f. sp. tritici PST-78]|uniref:Secreted protein n=1 Tax=Puccinia striiformis f. sp. tritici PST-78 TaxID=1165861 RepID=A0A0L0VSJ5_9BASI|nr:hypothetical protein PSTG_04452 [Puccinia striiformis f. sp. tritici PST-78]
MNLLSLINYLSCATIPAVLAAGTPKQPDPKTTVVFTCANFKTLHSGWCVAEERGKIGQGYHFVKANSVGPAEDKNYNCIGKKYGDNSACCLDDFIPDPKDLTPLDDNCKIKKSNGDDEL